MGKSDKKEHVCITFSHLFEPVKYSKSPILALSLFIFVKLPSQLDGVGGLGDHGVGDERLGQGFARRPDVDGGIGADASYALDAAVVSAASAVVDDEGGDLEPVVGGRG